MRRTNFLRHLLMTSLLGFSALHCQAQEHDIVVVANVGDGTDPLTLVLTKDEAAVEVAKRRRG